MSRRASAFFALAFVALIPTANAAPAPKAICAPDAVTLEGDAAVARNLKTVQSIYAAFSTGDVPAILACIAPEARWESWADNRAQAAGVPWLTERKAPEGVAVFFAYVGQWKVNAFAVKNVMAGGLNVAAEVEVDFDVTQTGGRIKDEEIHYWTFNERGQVTGLRHYNDTAKHIAAANGGR